MANVAGAKAGDVMCFGHTHVPWTRTVAGVRFINTGSVGRPKDGDPRAGFVLLTVQETRVDSEMIRVAYDVERTAAAIRESGLPDDFADYLLTGGRRSAPYRDAG
jgi:diadenosine tetraphosphatase ApaH/serine/threonine PP2A family protein phosphatase